jgi:uncharacterized protein
MRGFLRLALACAALALVVPASAEDAAAPQPDAARIAAARDLLEVTGVTKQMDGMVDAMSKGFAKGAKADTTEAGKKLSDQFDEGMKKFLEYKKQMIEEFAVLYAETFTAEEMKQVADFYRSGTGAKFITMMPQLMQKGAAIGMKYSEKIAKDMEAGAAPPAAAPAPEQK